ncbi:MAG: hypothetical protein K0S63_189, partial [Gammaproteobacteria bacterium]|nr:hypothetical protein [Gammaproteobacteria bacterium]
KDLVVKLSARYIQLYEMITGLAFQFPEKNMPAFERIKRNVAGWF